MSFAWSLKTLKFIMSASGPMMGERSISQTRAQNEAYILERSVSHLYGSGALLWGLNYILRVESSVHTMTCEAEVDLEDVKLAY